MDTCAKNPSMCGANSLCFDLAPGGYECRCEAGYYGNTTEGGDCTGVYCFSQVYGYEQDLS